MKAGIVTLAMILLTSLSVLAASPVEEGKTIFTTRCAGCHSISKNLTGPALGGVDQRRSMDWIINFVHSSQSMVKKGDKDAVAVFEQFNKIPMPDHLDLTDDNIKNIVAYITSEQSSAAKAEAAPMEIPTKIRPAYLPLSTDNYGLLLTYLALVALLAASLIFAVQVKDIRRRMTAQKEA